MLADLKGNICGEDERFLDKPTVLAELGRLMGNLVGEGMVMLNIVGMVMLSTAMSRANFPIVTTPERMWQL